MNINNCINRITKKAALEKQKAFDIKCKKDKYFSTIAVTVPKIIDILKIAKEIVANGLDLSNYHTNNWFEDTNYIVMAFYDDSDNRFNTNSDLVVRFSTTKLNKNIIITTKGIHNMEYLQNRLYDKDVDLEFVYDLCHQFESVYNRFEADFKEWFDETFPE